jgi:hypothetical protein
LGIFILILDIKRFENGRYNFTDIVKLIRVYHKTVIIFPGYSAVPHSSTAV